MCAHATPGRQQQPGAVMLSFSLLLLFQLLTLSLTLVTAVRHPSWRAVLLVGVALER